MRPRFLIYTLLLASVVLVVVFWLRPAKHAALQTPIKQEAIQPANSASAESNNVNQVVSNQQPISMPPANSSTTSDAVQQFVQTANSNYHKPIAFYGQVIDQDSNPISNVKVKVLITQEQMSTPLASANYPISNNIVHLEKETTADGRFEISGEWGSSLEIDSIDRDGYQVEPTPRSHGNLEGTFNSPVIFKMWSTNIHEQFITGSKSFQIVPDGRPYFINLTDGTVAESGSGDLKVSDKATGSNHLWKKI